MEKSLDSKPYPDSNPYPPFNLKKKTNTNLVCNLSSGHSLMFTTYYFPP